VSTTVPVPAPLASLRVPKSLFPISLVPWGPADGEAVQTPEDVARMLRLHALGCGAKRIVAEMGCARNTVTRYLAAGQWAPKAPQPRPKGLDALGPWIEIGLAPTVGMPMSSGRICAGSWDGQSRSAPWSGPSRRSGRPSGKRPGPRRALRRRPASSFGSTSASGA
jgi:hypothetical protein